MATKKAPVALTGGAGFEFDDCVAARFMIDLLKAGCSLGAEWGAVVRAPGRDANQVGSPTTLFFLANGAISKAPSLSLKRDRQVSNAGFPDDFRELAWEQWEGQAGATSIKGSNNEIGLAVGELAAGVERAWNAVATQVRESRSDLSRVLERLLPPRADDPGSQASALQRTLVTSLAREPGGELTVEALELIAQIRLLHLDFQSAAARQEVLALADCRTLLVSNDPDDAKALWTFLRGLADRKRASGGTIELVELLAELRPHFRLVTHPDFVADWRALDRHSAESMDLISSEIHQLGALERAEETKQVGDAIAGGNVAILVGASGSGKSGLVKKIALERGAGVVWLGPADLDFDLPSQFERHVGLGHTLGGVLAAAPTDCLLVFDAFEKLSARGQRLVEQLLAGWVPETVRQVAVVVTAQPEALGRIRPILAASGRAADAIASSAASTLPGNGVPSRN